MLPMLRNWASETWLGSRSPSCACLAQAANASAPACVVVEVGEGVAELLVVAGTATVVLEVTAAVGASLLAQPVSATTATASATTPMGVLKFFLVCPSPLFEGVGAPPRRVDRFRVVMFPVITGATGRERIYDGYPDVALDMVRSRTFDGQIQLVEYVPRVLDGPPVTS